MYLNQLTIHVYLHRSLRMRGQLVVASCTSEGRPQVKSSERRQTELAEHYRKFSAALAVSGEERVKPNKYIYI